MKKEIVFSIGILIGICTVSIAQNQSAMKTTNQKNVNVQKKDNSSQHVGTTYKKGKKKTNGSMNHSDTMTRNK